MKIPEGYEDFGKMCKLNIALYRLEQAPLTWNQTFTLVLRKSGLTSTQNKRCIFKNEDGTIILAVHVDDGIIVSDKEEKIQKLLKLLKTKFEIKGESNPMFYWNGNN